MDASSLPPEVWEALCRRCGRCCTEKVLSAGRVVLTTRPCRFLDGATRTCSVYGDRFRAEPGCVSSVEGLARGVFPADCPYTFGIPGYRPPLEADAEAPPLEV